MKKIKIKLSAYFAILVSFLILVTIGLFAIFVSFSIDDLAGKYTANIKQLQMTMSEMFARALESDRLRNDFTTTQSITELLKKKEFLLYIYVKDNDTDKVIVGVVSDDKEATKDLINSGSIKELRKQLKNITIILGINSDNTLDRYKNSFNWLIFRFLIFFILFGMAGSWLMSKLISKPLERLTKAAKEISDGNFGVKVPGSNFSEINDLAFSYNEMTFQLNELYSSLELKVQERTIALEEANYKLKEAQAMMVHSEKMRSLGELVAGIAHEINNPVNFIHGNIMILQNYADDLIKLIDLYDENSALIPEEKRAKIEAMKEEIDLEFLRGDIKDLIKSCIEGTQRTKNIVLDLKNFSRMEEMVLTQFDIPKEIDTTLNILNNKYKNRITVIKNYSPDVPKIEAYGGQLNQVFMNILDNAQDAMAESGTLTINVTKADSSNVKIEFIDTGAGIPKENLKKVFDPFFTTKPVGKGTGLGMSISYRVINDHKGKIEVESEVGKGTKFTIILPINHEEAKAV